MPSSGSRPHLSKFESLCPLKKHVALALACPGKTMLDNAKQARLRAPVHHATEAGSLHGAAVCGTTLSSRTASRRAMRKDLFVSVRQTFVRLASPRKFLPQDTSQDLTDMEVLTTLNTPVQGWRFDRRHEGAGPGPEAATDTAPRKGSLNDAVKLYLQCY